MKYQIILLLTLTTIIFVTGCSTIAGTPPQIELSTSSFNLGDINPDEGLRTETFSVKNTGGSPLLIESVSTSCGCTDAEIESENIPPGEETTLTIVYDPSVHPGLVGKIKRIVYIQSNDPVSKEVELELIGNSLLSSETNQEDETTEDDHDEAYEDLLKDFEISPPALYNKIKAGESIKLLDVRENFEYEENHITNTQLLSVNSISQSELDSLGLKKDDEIILYCRSGSRSARAYEMLNAMGYTNVKSLYGGIVHWMEDEYPVEQGMNLEELIQEPTLGNQASIVFDRSEHDFGNLSQFGGIVNTTFTITNQGSDELKITSVSTSCGCASAKLEELVISPGDSTILTVFFDPDFHEEPAGRFSRTVFLETNDPNNLETEVSIFMDILEGK